MLSRCRFQIPWIGAGGLWRLGLAAIAVDYRSEWSRAISVTGAKISEIQHHPNKICPMHWHPHPSLGIVLDGEVAKRFTSCYLRIEKNNGFTLPAGILHSDHFGPGSRVVMIELDETHPLSSERLEICKAVFETRQVLRDQRLGGLGQRIASELRRSDGVTTMAMDALVAEVLSVAARVNGENSTTSIPDWLLEAREIARNSTRNRIQIVDIARQVGVHPAYLARRFRAEFGVTPGVYARNARLQWAAEQLINTKRTIAEIADEAGFADQSHFTRAFRKYVDQTPAQYRDVYRQDRSRS